MSLLAYLSDFISMSEPLAKALSQKVTHIQVQKNDILLRTGQRCDSMYFITKGLVRGYYFDEDKEITTWFAQENEFAACFYSFVTQTASVENIQALEPCELSMIKYNDLQDIYREFPEVERIGRLITETYYIKLEERFLSNQFKTAKERYQWLMTAKKGIPRRAPLGHIAGYLGITQETLSRIRAEV